ncbi:MAG: hypothetical protein DSY43_01425 [Gammaproteobacteria bacterium]|nr:MAG: hypothetical protein DSY43_01425 [Gammaproteobacteria bacterium]
MSESKGECIFYRGEKIEIDENGRVPIEGQQYLVINSLTECRDRFEETKDEGFEFLDSISISKKNLDERCVFNFEISLTDDDFTSSGLFIFCNNIFLKEVTIKRSYLISGEFDKTTSIYPREQFNEKPNIPNFAFWNTKFEDECLIEFDHKENDLSFIFNWCHFSKKLKIRNSEHRAQLSGGTDFEKYEIVQETKLHLNKLHLIDCSANDGVYLRIGFVSVKDFVLSNLKLPQNAELNIEDCHFENFKLTNFRNIGKFRLYKINILNISHDYFENTYQKDETSDNKKFQIDNTSIGKTDFQSVNIGSFNEVVIFDNIFTEIDYTNLIWGDKDIGVEQTTGDENELEKKQDTYRILKNVASRNNDQPQAIKFFAKEMDYHYQIVKNNQEYSLSDRATLRFNKYTNDFALDLFLPLKWLLFFSIFLYIFLLYLLPISDLSVNVLDDLSKFFARFFIFLNPSHKVKDVFGGDWSGLTYAIDFIFRIIEGLLVYQTIQAFRKYSRKL